MIWLWAGGIVLLFVLLGFACWAFWEEWPPLDDTPLPSEEEPSSGAWSDGPLPTGPTAEEWMWSPSAVHRARHRREDIGQGTIRLPWYDVPSGPQPIYPKPDQVE